MDPSQLNLLFGRTAILGAVAAIVTLVARILFFSLGGVYGKTNEAGSVVLMLRMLPVVAVPFFLIRVTAPGLAGSDRGCHRSSGYARRGCSAGTSRLGCCRS